MKIFTKIITLLLFVVPVLSKAQTTINVYARVTAINSKTISITNATGTFTSGEAIIMQVQDSILGTNTANNTNFGKIASIQSAGLSEIVNITAVSGSTVTLSNTLTNTYHLGNNSRVQIISYPTLGAGGDYTLSTALTAAAWNGNTGGVVAFKVKGTLTINNNIIVDAQGFRGGAAGTNAPSDLSCDANTYYDNAAGASTLYSGFKGEGIYNSNGSYLVARGMLANGAGGANTNNGGGGGGGNFSAGGAGGLGWTCTLSTTGGGVGGADLSSYVSGNRFFLGGGGGGGQQNNNVGTAGGNGGGIIMISAFNVKTNTGCNSGAGKVILSANGQKANNSGNDGSGGGGAGGSILLQVPSYSISNGCPLNVNANAGNGGSVNDPGAHGGGGGGGKGLIIFSGIIGKPTNSVVTDTAGTGGGNSNVSGAATAGGGSSSGTSGGSSVIYVPLSLLPVNLVSFTAAVSNNSALLQWQSAIETDFSHYEIEMAVSNTQTFTAVGKVIATGNNSLYKFAQDLSNLNANESIYFRLKMVDINGAVQYSAIRTITLNHTSNAGIKAYPNPALATVYINLGTAINSGTCNASMLDMQGRMIKCFGTMAVPQNKTIGLSLNGLLPGQYIVSIVSGGVQEHMVILKQ